MKASVHSGRRWGLGVLAATAFLISACSTPTIYHSTRYADFPTHFAVYDSDTPYVATRVIGNPFGVPRETLNSEVTAAMAEANPGFGLRYTTDPAVHTREGVGMAILFGGAPTIGGGSLCSVAPEKFAIDRDSRPIAVRMALCHGNRPLSTLSASLGPITDPTDPAFGEFVEMMTERLFENAPLPGDPSQKG
ncbi:MAG: hypothetical protein CMM50_02615 [Rhodospirillaceae bacterium]|nr:hypothetical protein [Rhodospirillaceae bacterium]|tara:strand:- start:66 stop:641 length:576 start_codon:yes stop_codon:yes gene_type:complete